MGGYPLPAGAVVPAESSWPIGHVCTMASSPPVTTYKCPVPISSSSFCVSVIWHQLII